MSIIEKYEKVREAGRKLVNKMLDVSVSKDILEHSAKLLYTRR